jgi:transcriptional regulator with XRE-family HTH domain
MSFSDISARFKQQQDAAPAPTASLVTDAPAETYLLRAKMLGVLLRDARLHGQRSLDECARVLRVEPALVEAWEYGEATPSLPQLEILATYLDVPISQFWSSATLGESLSDRADAQREYQALRDRMIGVLLRQAREAAGMSVEVLAERAHLTPEQVERYELGEVPLPMHLLAVLANAVNRNMSYFLESSSHIGELLAQREAWERFTQMPEDMRQFVTNPSNVAFIEIARMFAAMPTEQLRKIGEHFLEITL